MPKVRVVRHRRKHPDDPIVMEIGEPAPPGTPVGETCWLPFEQIKHLLPADFRLARPGTQRRGPPSPRCQIRFVGSQSTVV